MWVQPAAGDAGGAIGAALAAYYQFAGSRARRLGETLWRGAILGRLSPKPNRGGLAQAGAVFSTLTDEALIERAARRWSREARSAGSRGEWSRPAGTRRAFDPRRSRSPRMQSSLNLRVKFRESFRPFAPAVLSEDVAEWFNLAAKAPTCRSSRTYCRNTACLPIPAMKRFSASNGSIFRGRVSRP